MGIVPNHPLLPHIYVQWIKFPKNFVEFQRNIGRNLWKRQENLAKIWKKWCFGENSGKLWEKNSWNFRENFNET